MREHTINKLDNFIQGWYLNNNNICDKLIDYFVNSSHKCIGKTGYGVDKTIKDSTDVSVDVNMAIEYNNFLQPVLEAYCKKYKWCNSYSTYTITEPPVLQHYKVNSAYHSWHTERTDSNPKRSTRHMVFMTYLNDVVDGGETEFYYQQIKVKPEKGLTLIWPTDWTFTHRGVPSPTQEKYIITGWYNFIEPS